MKKIFGLLGVVVALGFVTKASAASFTPGNILVYRIGDASTNALVNSGSPVFLDEISIVDGSTVQSISIPTNSYFGANAPVIASGVASAEGLMTRSVDGRFVVFTGYATSIGAGSSSLSGLGAQTVPRVIGTVDQSGRLDTTTLQTNSLSSGDDIRSATSTDGTNLWFSGDTSGLRYTTRGSTAAAQLSTNITNLRQVNIFSNTLYFSTASGTNIHIGTVTTNGIPNISTNGLPTLAGTGFMNSLSNFSAASGSPYAFALFQLPGGTNTLNTLYVADDGTGGIYKYSLMNNGTWVSNGVVLFTNARYLVGTNDSLGNVQLYAAGAPAAGAGPYFGGGNLVSYTDTTGFNAAPLGNGDPGGIGDFANWAINPPINAVFRGIAFTPVGSETFPSGSPQLSVGPITDVFFSKGFTGGPFSFTKNYSVANFGVGTMTWSVSATSNWVGFSTTGGTLPSGGSITVTVSFNANANSLLTGTNLTSITFTNSTAGNNGFDVTSRPVTLILSSLGVSPSSNLFVTGPVNGPYTPANSVYTLTNGSANTLTWGASVLSSNWITLSSSGGLIPAGGKTTVTVSITNANALALSRGAFLDTVAFTNVVAGDPGNALRTVSLLIGGGFTSNNLVVYRTGDGTVTLSNHGTPVFMDEYTRSGVLIESIPVSTNNYCASGVATAEGLMTRSTDKQYLVFVGYGTNATYTSASVALSTTANVSRVIGRVDGNGNVDVTTRLTDFASASNPRAAVSTNGVDMWVAGAVGGIRHTSLGRTTSDDVCTNPTANFRALNIYSNQLYAGTASAAIRITTVGSGLPTSDTTAVNLPGYSTTEVSPYNFVLFQLQPGATAPFDTLYVADDQGNSGAADNGAGAVFKWSLVGGTWTSNGFVNIHAVRGLAGDVSIVGTTTNVNLFAVGSQNTASGTLTAFTDSSGYNTAPTGNGGPVGTVIATASANERWDSIALAPEIPAAAAISVSPGDFIVTDGPSSVTTNSRNYLVSDVGSSSMTWTATWSSTWLSLSTFGGTNLAAGGNTNVVASINGNATSLANGTYLDTITFSNKSGGLGTTTRGVSLTITGSVVVADAFTTWQNQYFNCTGCPQAQGGADPFGKGMSNTNQFLAGFDPTNRSAYVHITAISRTNSTDVRVDYLGASGNSAAPTPLASRTNVLEFTAGTNGNYNTNNFASTGQTNILSGGNGSGTLANMVDPGGATNVPSRYYRVRVLVP